MAATSIWNGPSGKLERLRVSNFQTLLSPSLDSDSSICAAAVRLISRDCKSDTRNGGRAD